MRKNEKKTEGRSVVLSLDELVNRLLTKATDEIGNEEQEEQEEQKERNPIYNHVWEQIAEIEQENARKTCGLCHKESHEEELGLDQENESTWDITLEEMHPIYRLTASSDEFKIEGKVDDSEVIFVFYQGKDFVFPVDNITMTIEEAQALNILLDTLLKKVEEV